MSLYPEGDGQPTRPNAIYQSKARDGEESGRRPVRMVVLLVIVAVLVVAFVLLLAVDPGGASGTSTPIELDRHLIVQLATAVG